MLENIMYFSFLLLFTFCKNYLDERTEMNLRKTKELHGIKLLVPLFFSSIVSIDSESLLWFFEWDIGAERIDMHSFLLNALCKKKNLKLIFPYWSLKILYNNLYAKTSENIEIWTERKLFIVLKFQWMAIKGFLCAVWQMISIFHEMSMWNQLQNPRANEPINHNFRRTNRWRQNFGKCNWRSDVSKEDLRSPNRWRNLKGNAIVINRCIILTRMVVESCENGNKNHLSKL